MQIPIIDKKRYGVSHQFKVVLHDVALVADVSETTAAKAQLGTYAEAIVTIVHDGTSKELMDKVLHGLGETGGNSADPLKQTVTCRFPRL